MMGPDVDCPECGVYRVREGVSRCSVCEVAARYEEKMAGDADVVAAARALYDCAKGTVEKFGGGISIYEAAKFSACHGALCALIDACTPTLAETLRDTLVPEPPEAPTLTEQDKNRNAFHDYEFLALREGFKSRNGT